MLNRVAKSILLVIALFAATSTNAAPVTFQFAGEITDVIDPNDYLSGEVVVGTTFSGQFTFETDTPDDAPNDANHGDYFGVTSFFGEIEGHAFYGDSDQAPFLLVIGNDYNPTPTDRLSVGAPVYYLNIPADGGLSLVDQSGTAFDSDAFPDDFPDFDMFDVKQFGFGNQPLNVFVTGDLTEFSVVPEPGTMGLLLVGVILSSARGRTGCNPKRKK